jgi:hypothetical protein
MARCLSTSQARAGRPGHSTASTPEHREGKITTRREKRRLRPRGYADWRPQARTKALLLKIEAVIDEYEPYLPLTVRQVFYRLVASHGYEKTEPAYKRLGEHLNRARRAGLIPFETIRDDGVITHRVDFYAGVEDFWDDAVIRARRYRRNRQEGQSVRVELWCEAAGMLGQLSRVTSEYSVPVYSCGGFSSLTANYGVAQRALDRTQPTVLLHVGDHDPSGQAIFEAMAEDAAAFARADRITHNLGIEAQRVALTAEQVSRYELPTAPPKKSDGRSARWRGQTCQLEALAPDQLADIVRHAIEGRLDLERFEDQVAAEEADRRDLLGGLPAGDHA